VGARAPVDVVDSIDAQAGNLRKQRLLFWLVTAVVALMIAFPWYGSLFLE